MSAKKIEPVEIHLKDYLQPRGKYPYESLSLKLEQMNQDGIRFYLVAVHGGLMGTNHPEAEETATGYPFSNMMGEWFKTAADLLSLKNGKQIEDF